MIKSITCKMTVLKNQDLAFCFLFLTYFHYLNFWISVYNFCNINFFLKQKIYSQLNNRYLKAKILVIWQHTLDILRGTISNILVVKQREKV